jgi:hypothetical protein
MWHSDNPLNEALVAITNQTPPFDLDGIMNSSDLPDTVALQLSDWCSLNANPEWATGSGILEAANLLVERALENGNIKPTNLKS